MKKTDRNYSETDDLMDTKYNYVVALKKYLKEYNLGGFVMVYFKLIELNEHSVIYEYYPENKRDYPGVIVINRNRDDIKITESEEDFGKRYAFHALRVIEHDDFTEEGMEDWY